MGTDSPPFGLRVVPPYDPEAAIDRCKQALISDPSNPQRHFDLAEAYRSQDTKEGLLTALSCFRESLYFDPDFLEARFAIAECLEALGSPYDADEQYRDVLNRDPPQETAEKCREALARLLFP